MKRVLLITALLAACGKDAPQPAPTPVPEPALDVSSRDPDPPTAVRATHEELFLDTVAERHPSDGGGRGWLIEGPERIVARGIGAWTFGFEVGPLGVAEGGAVSFMVSPFWDWTHPQDYSNAMRGYTKVELQGQITGDPLKLDTEAFDQLFMAQVSGRALEPGEVLIFHYGADGSGAQADRYAEREERFWFGVDGDGDGIRKLVADPPTVTIEARAPSQAHLFLPPTARPGDTVVLTATLLDDYGNAGYPFVGELRLARDGRWPGILPERLLFGAADFGTVTHTFTLPDDAQAGAMRLAGGAISTAPGQRQTRMTALSNPMWIAPDAPRILVGDLHGHSNLSDGTGLPQDFFTYADTHAGLDFAVLTDHDHWGVRFLDEHPDMWDQIQRAVERANKPGRFTALLGFEWTSWIHGHRHVVYFQDEGEVISSMDAGDPDALWAKLRELADRGLRALTFAHHSAGAPVPTNWSFPPDPEFEPVTEVSSVHGTSEAWDAPAVLRGAWKGNFVRDVLDAGVQLGFVGSGDSHDGHPGLAHVASGNGGLALLFSETNDREGVRAALQSRACYATNGERIVLIAHLGGVPMGGTLTADSLKPAASLELALFGTADLVKLEVIRSGEVVASLGRGALGQTDGLPPDFKGSLDAAELGLEDLRPGEYVYLRATQAGTGLAWSSPWFIE